MQKEGYIPPSTLFTTLIERIENDKDNELTAKSAAASAYLGTFVYGFNA